LSSSPCPDEDALLSLAAGDAVADGVRAHAESCAACRRRLEGLRAGVFTLRSLFGQQAASPEAIPSTIKPVARPAQIGDYYIVGTLGEGPEAVVYRGLHAELNREVVLAVSRTAVIDDADRAALIAEGEELAQLDHPHLARTLDLDFHDDRPFLVSEHVEGATLAEHAAEEGTSAPHAAELVARVARALAAAHQEGVVHGAIKPSSIRVDADGRPVLVDLGLARLRHFLRAAQASSPTDEPPPASDVQSLGGVLCSLLTGNPPSADAAALDAPSIPRPLAALCRQALSARADERPSAESFAADLEKLAQSRDGRLVPSALSAGLAGVVGLASRIWPASRLPPAPGVQTLLRLHQRVEPGNERRFHRPQLPDYLAGGDLIDVSFEVPPNSEAALFWLGTTGTLVQREPAQAGDGKTGPRLRYPSNRLATVTGRPGTELVLVVANRKGRPLPTLEEMKALLAEVSGKAPPVSLGPSDPHLLLHRDAVEGAETAPPTARQRLEALRLSLRQRYDWFWGVALPHR
jgi:serine/threonine protein kinase